ncbi:hypothetical protein SKAU_G00348990 [Synaphobranchus kaupii]|uniref:Uncharacterized protein n=1 Tax=Synaphobranchus kaupii TaxID=118154 RepID=A0A9Q1EK33_SYNKA|nr:hypothetical protein SKAU_G00348990 [Synaphobranchus kaupii]
MKLICIKCDLAAGALMTGWKDCGDKVSSKQRAAEVPEAADSGLGRRPDPARDHLEHTRSMLAQSHCLLCHSTINHLALSPAA